MVKVFLFMYICSTVPGNECKLMPTDINQFDDVYECTIYGYKKSLNIISILNREFVNQHGAHTKFICQPQQTI